jgi:DNA-binding transcriptional ArsR family regulator
LNIRRVFPALSPDFVCFVIFVCFVLSLPAHAFANCWNQPERSRLLLRNRTVARTIATVRLLNCEWLRPLVKMKDSDGEPVCVGLRWHDQIPIKMRRDIFQAIADPTRRAIISLIALQAMTPNALAEHFQTSRQAVSRHIKILTECEILKQEQQGREIYYSLEIDKMKEIDNWLNQFRKIWETRFNQLDIVLSTFKKRKK